MASRFEFANRSVFSWKRTNAEEGGDGGGVIVLCGMSRLVVINLGFNIVRGFLFKSKGPC